MGLEWVGGGRRESHIQDSGQNIRYRTINGGTCGEGEGLFSPLPEKLYS
jgi:hypothetical protein